MADKRTICVAGKHDIACNVMNYLIQNYKSDYNLAACCNRTETGDDGWQRSYRAYIKRFGIAEKKLDELYDIEHLVFISAEFDKIIRPDLFQDAALYNIHFSLLPAYRGMYTAILPILCGEERSGVTLHEIDAGIDTGQIIAQREFDLTENMTSRDLYLRCMNEGTMLIIEYMQQLLNRSFQSFAQPVKGASYFSKKAIDFNNINICLDTTAYQIQNQLRAFTFKEYQLPRIMNREVAAWKITDCRSVKPMGTIEWEGKHKVRISTADYDMMIDFL